MTRFRTRIRASAYHPELRTISRCIPGRAVSGPRTLHLLRRLQRLKRAPDVEIQSCGPCAVAIYRPLEGSGRGVVVWLHGGGMILGSGMDDGAGLQRLAEELDALVISVDYRLAPEHAYPIPFEDCYSALRWAAALPAAQGMPLIVAGGSAGAGLAAGVALAARDRGDVAVTAQILIYPMLDDRSASRPDPMHRFRRLWDKVANEFGWRSYLADLHGTEHVPVYAAPGRATDLSGLPPTWIGVGTLDLFYDEDVAYAERLKEAGVPCELVIVDGAFHGFDLAAKTRVARAFRDSYISAMKSALSAAA